MTEIDERIIAAHWDGKDFEKGAKQAISTLEKLKESFNFEGSADSLSDLASSIKEIDFGDSASKAEKLGNALKSIPKALGKAAFSPIAKIGSALSSLAKQVKAWFGIDLARDIEKSLTGAVKALTVEPIKMGWDEYEMKMDSIKTIMTGTADEFAGLSDKEHMGKVKETLEELNHYADETIYSFKDMTANIGKFTNAGVHLDVAARSMMGISNLAAKAGQGTQQASMAMYNFSQSMGLGYVELRDWRSIENANMATLEFKETLMDVGVALGTLKKDSKGVITTNVKGEKKVAVTAKNLRETLQKKWLTSDVLEKTLEIYSGNLGEKELKAMGNFTDEQIAAFLKIGAEAKEAATQVRTFSKMWDALREAAQSGWAVSFEKIIGDMNEATEFWSGINKRISGWLETSADHRNAILNQWRGLTGDGELRISEIDGRQEMINSLHNILTIIENISSAIKGAITSVFGELTGSQLRDWSVRFREFTDNVIAWLGSMDDGNSRLSKLSRALKGPLSIIKAVIKVLRTVGEIMIDMIFPFFDPIINFFELVGETISDILEGNFSFEKLGNQLMGLGTSIVGAGVNIWENIKKWFNKLFKKDDSTIKKPIGEWFSGIGTAFNEWISRIKNFIHWDELKQWFANVFDQVVTFFLGEKAWRMTTGENVRKKSQFTKLFEFLAEGFNTGLTNFKSLVHWEDIKATAASIFDNIKTWFIGEEKEDRLTGEKVKTKSSFQIAVDNIVAAVSGFITTASSWEGWTVFGDFCTSIYNSIVDFCTPKEDGSPSKLKETFDSIVGKVNEFINTVKSWGIWDILDEHLIQPFRKLWNLIFHGDADYDEKKTKAFAPIGVIAAGMASDRPLLKKEEKENQNIFKSIASGLSESLQEILNAFHIFSADEEGKFDPIGRFNEWASNLGTRISEAWAPVGENIQTIAADISSTATTLQEAVGKIVAWIVESPWDEWFHDINEKLRELGGTFAIFEGGSLLGGLGKSANGLGRFLYSLAGINKEIKKNGGLKFKFNFGTVGEGLKNLFTDTGKAFKALGKNAAGWLKNPKDLGKKFGQIFGGFREGQVTSTERAQTFANVLVELAGAVGIMAWAITNLIDKVKEINELDVDGTTNKSEAVWERLEKLFKIIGTALAVTEFTALLQGAFGQSKANVLANGLIGFAAAIGSMILALNTLVGTVQTTRADQISKAIELLSELSIVIGAFDIVHQVSSIGDHNSKSGLIGFAIAMEGLVLELGQLIEVIKTAKEEDIDSAYELLFKLSEIIDIFVGVKNLTSSSIGPVELGSGSNKTGLIGFALAIEALLHAVKEIAELSKDGADLGAASDMIEQLGGVINKFQIFKNLSSFKIGSISVGGGKSGMIGFVVAMTSLVNSVIRLAKNDPKKIEQAEKVVESLGEMLTKFVRTRNFGSLFSAAFNVAGFEYKGGKASGILGFILAINELLIAAALIADGDVDKMKQAELLIERVGGMITAFTAIYDVTSGIGSTGQRVSAMLAMVAFAGALWLIMQQVTEFSKMDDTQFNNADRMMTRVQELVKSLALVLIGSDGVVAAIAMVKNVDAKTMALGALKVLEGLAIVFGGLILGGGLFGWLLGFLDEGFLTQLEQGAKVAGKVGNLLGEFVHGLVAPFFDHDETEDIKAMNTKLADIDEGEMDHAIAIMGKVRDFGESLRGFNPSIFQQWFSGDITLGQFATYMTELAGGLAALGTVGTDPTAIANAEVAIGALQTIANLATNLVSTEDNYAIEGLIDRIYQLADATYYSNGTNEGSKGLETLISLFGKLGEAIAKGIEQGSADITGESIIDKIVRAIESGGPRISEAVASAIRAGIDGVDLSKANSSAQTGNPITQPLVDGAKQSAAELESRAGEVADNAVDALGAAGTKMGDYVIDGMLRIMNGEDPQTVLNEFGTKAGTTLTETASEFGTKAGETMGFNFSQEVGKSSDDTYKSATQIPTAAANAINDHTDTPVRAIRNMGSSMVLAFNETLSINSPSKVFYDQTQFIVDAIALSLSQHQPVLDAIRNIGSDMMSSWQTALNPIDAYLQGKSSIGANISPVYNMSSARSGVNSLLANRFSLNSQVPPLTRNIQVPSVQENRQNGSQLAVSISEKLDQLNANIANLKLYLDTGALVGGTVDAYDRALGFRASRARRG